MGEQPRVFSPGKEEARERVGSAAAWPVRLSLLYHSVLSASQLQ